MSSALVPRPKTSCLDPPQQGLQRQDPDYSHEQIESRLNQNRPVPDDSRECCDECHQSDDQKQNCCDSNEFPIGRLSHSRRSSSAGARSRADGRSRLVADRRRRRAGSLRIAIARCRICAIVLAHLHEQRGAEHQYNDHGHGLDTHNLTPAAPEKSPPRPVLTTTRTAATRRRFATKFPEIQ